MFNALLKNLNFKRALISLGFGMLGALIIQGAISFVDKPTIATVNITGILNSFVKETAKQNLTMLQKQQKVDEFGVVMQRVLVDMAQKRHIAMLISESVIVGAPDLTSDVVGEIKKELQK